MSGYTKVNLRQVDDQAPNFGMPSEMQARFARTPVEGETLGLSLFTLEPGFRIPFGHKHASQEEVYVIVSGSARVKVEDEIVDSASGMRSASTPTRCGPWRRGRMASSMSPSAPAPTRARSRWRRTSGPTDFSQSCPERPILRDGCVPPSAWYWASSSEPCSR